MCSIQLLERAKGNGSNAHVLQAMAADENILSAIRFTKEYEEIGVNAPVWQNISALVERATASLHITNALHTTHITVKNEIPLGLKVFADPLIPKVFDNLINNSLRHGGDVKNIRFFAEENAGSTSIVYEDDGCGIIPKVREHLFKKGKEPHGLGLFLSSEILSITGITITENGEHGKGARFVMTFPPEEIMEST